MEIATKRSTNMGPFFLGFILGSVSSYVYRWYQNRDVTQTTDRPCGAETRPPPYAQAREQIYFPSSRCVALPRSHVLRKRRHVCVRERAI